MDDNLELLYGRFVATRSKPLSDRFSGVYRAEVVETNDPLQMHRVRFRCPDLHDISMPAQLCPWAVPCNKLGGLKAGSWTHPCIGDWIWVTFERGHPYGPVWIGFADPLRRQSYPLSSVYGKTPLPVNATGYPTTQPLDYNQKYLPKDNRPMSCGVNDRYGNLDIFSSIGFYPSTHKLAPVGSDNDAVQSLKTAGPNNKEKFTPFGGTPAQPVVNDPDCKFMARISKYGHILLLGDQGYSWRKKSPEELGEETSTVGEFTGDPDKDTSWEFQRWKSIQEIINEGKSKDHDQRRFMVLTRYGHRIEARDAGWNWTRRGEYESESRQIASGEHDQRWIKLRTKGGMLIQALDVGFDQKEDVFVNRPLYDEYGYNLDHEDEWPTNDARMIRFVTRYGYKFVLDDRGSDTKDAEGKENPTGHGLLIKGRRSPGTNGHQSDGDPRGFFLEFNERDYINHTTWGTPVGITAQMSDKLQYAMICARAKDYSPPWKKLKDNEFTVNPLAALGVDDSSYVLKLDLQNEYLSLKTRGGRGSGPFGSVINPSGVTGDLQQGLECRDGILGDGPWVELVDSNHRGLWLWGKNKLVVCRASTVPFVDMSWWFDENLREIIIAHNEITGRIQIYSTRDIEILAANEVKIHSATHTTLSSDSHVTLVGGGGKLEVRGGRIVSTVPVYAPKFIEQPVPVANTMPPVKHIPLMQREPLDRGMKYN